MRPKQIPRACGLVSYLLTVSRCSSWHLRLHSCPVWVNNLAVGFQPLLETRYIRKGTHKSTRDVWHELVWYVFEYRVTWHMSYLAEWSAVRWGPTPTPGPVYQVVMQPRIEGWLLLAVSLWWRSWNMIMIPNHRTCMIPLWQCELWYRVEW